MKRFSRISILLLVIVFLASTLPIATPVYAAVSFTGTELLGRPTANSITINVVPNTNIDLYYEYGTSTGSYSVQTAVVTAAAGQPCQTVITGLDPNTRYYYRMQYKESGGAFTARPEYSFMTQRASGNEFTFDITSDSHVNIMLGSDSVWKQALDRIDTDNPDFLIDLGDTFAMDSVASAAAAEQNYLFQRDSERLGQVSHSSPIFLALGNHEEEEGWHLDDNGNPANSQPVWGANARKKYFPNPVPDGSFYTGDTDTYSYLNGDQLREDYYAWTWGDALFVVIDPFWFTMTKPFSGNTGGGENSDTGSGDRWDWTLGAEQFNWLKTTLQNSSAKYKFIFAHHYVGGSDDYVRGGAVPAHICEWGGYNENGTTWGWSAERDAEDFGSEPIHQILQNTNVSAFFHGHDHQYAYEIRDGIVYQALPSASFSGNFGIYNESNEYTERVLSGPGYLRVTVDGSQTDVEYINSTSGAVSHSYSISPSVVGPTYDLTAAIDPPSSGTITPAVGTHTYSENSVVNITATPAAGYRFDSWSGALTGSTNPTSITMDANKSVTANFVAKTPCTLNVTVSPAEAASAGCTVGKNPSSPYYTEDATVVTLTANGTAKWSFAGWSGDLSGTDNPETITMNGDKSVTAAFAKVNEAPVVSAIPDQTVAKGNSFAAISLDNYVADPDNADNQLAWSYSGNSQLGVSITNRVATVSVPNADWTGSETITFKATDPGALFAEDAATFTVVSGSLTAIRDLPATVTKGQTFPVAITFSAPANDFNAVGLNDLVPAGWTIALDETACEPDASFSNSTDNKAQYIWNGPYSSGTAFTAVYQVTAPAEAAAATYNFSGTLEYYLAGAGPSTIAISGDTQLSVVEGAAVQGVTYNVKGEVLSGVTLTLTKDSTTLQVTSGADGSYQITVPAAGEWTLTASKTGYRNQSQTVTVTELGAAYTVNFKGDASLIPDAMLLEDVLACINKWKYPPADGTGLGFNKILAVINAWKYPIQ